RGPASQMTRLTESGSATQPPLDVLANEVFHQVGSMGLQKPANRLLQHLGAAVEPSLFDQGVNLAIQALGDFGLNRSHGTALVDCSSTFCTNRPTPDRRFQYMDGLLHARRHRASPKCRPPRQPAARAGQAISGVFFAG